MIKKKHYYSLKRTLRVNIIDVQTRTKITPDAIYINGTQISSWSSDSTYNCIISEVPSSFTLIVQKTDYWDHNRSWLFTNLDTLDVTLVPKQTVNSFNMEVHWTPPEGTAYDLDLHMVILDASTGQEVSGSNHLYYGSGGSGTGYTSSITQDNNVYKLNYDDDPSAQWGTSSLSKTKNNHTENITGNLVSGRIYRFILEDFVNQGHMNYTDCKVTTTLTFDGSGTPQTVATSNTYKYWIVCLLKEITENGQTYWVKDTSVEEYTNTSPY